MQSHYEVTDVETAHIVTASLVHNRLCYIFICVFQCHKNLCFNNEWCMVINWKFVFVVNHPVEKGCK